MAGLTLDQHLSQNGPKRILSLDGGGVRGVLALSFLARIEALLQERYSSDRLVLSDYFDLIGGTSTGAIIAAGLAKGYPVRTLQELYQEMAKDIFRRKPWRQGLVFAKYRHRGLRRLLEEHFGEYSLGDPRLRTGIMIVTKRWDTGSPWVLHNHPRGRYYDRGASSRVPNRYYNLAQIVRASTAAPTFFRPESITVGKGVEGRFVDGGVTPHNNPALQLLLLATLHGYGFRWTVGRDKLLLISVGTGAKDPKVTVTLRERLARKLAIYDGLTSLVGLMTDCDALNQTILQAISDTPTRWHIDRDIGDLRLDSLTEAPVISYRRYSVLLMSDWLNRELGLAVSDNEANDLFRMDKPKNMARLAEIGDLAARQQVSQEHLPSSFDLPQDMRP